MSWPAVMGEFETMRLIASGCSLARFGDGELKMIEGAGYCREPPSAKLSAELLATLLSEDTGLLIGIPTMDPDGAKIANWRKHEPRFLRILPRGRLFVSAFVTRPDSAQWIRSIDFLELVESVWCDRRVAVLCEKGNKLLKIIGLSASCMMQIRCPHRLAFAEINRLEAEILATGAELAVLSCGSTATCLARRLHRRGMQALDFGSAGGFLAALRAGKA